MFFNRKPPTEAGAERWVVVGIQFEFQTYAECDKCGCYVAKGLYKSRMIEELRVEGWKIGKYVTCPECCADDEDI